MYVDIEKMFNINITICACAYAHVCVSAYMSRFALLYVCVYMSMCTQVQLDAFTCPISKMSKWAPPFLAPC